MLSGATNLTVRQEDILQGVLSSFVETNEPIGSKTLAKKYVSNLSSATIRNELAELTELGFLCQPHTSAGRVPTDKAYRFYVNQVKKLPALSEMEVERIRIGYGETRSLGLEGLLEQTSKLLSSLTRQASLVLIPNLSRTVLSQIRIVRLRPNLAHVIVVTKNGRTQNRSIEMEEDLSQEFLDRMSRYLNEEYKGLTLQEVRRRISLQMLEHKKEFDILFRESLKLSKKAFLESPEETDEFYIWGTHHIFDQPEFQTDVEKMRMLFEAFQEKEKLVEILDRFVEAEGISVSIGPEIEVEAMNDCAFVMKTYSDGSRNLGTLAIIGPKRMRYPRIMALVDMTASTLSRFIAAESSS